MVTRLLIVRHGASHHRADGVVGGPRSCPGLTAEGRAQVEMLGKVVPDFSFSHTRLVSRCMPNAMPLSCGAVKSTPPPPRTKRPASSKGINKEAETSTSPRRHDPAPSAAAACWAGAP